MNESTEGVRIHAGFISELLQNYESSRETIAAPLFEMTKAYDLREPTAWVPMELYNAMCRWIQENLGPANLKLAGQKIGERVYTLIESSGAAGEHPTPLSVLNALKHAAETMIDDPHKRGWEILEHSDEQIIMRRTQTFNSALQHGLISALIARTGVRLPTVTLDRAVARGDEFDEYRISWVTVPAALRR